MVAVIKTVPILMEDLNAPVAVVDTSWMWTIEPAQVNKIE